jgi:hypothetical protein
MKINPYRILVGKAWGGGRDHLGGLGVDRRIIFGFNWFTIGFSGGFM